MPVDLHLHSTYSDGSESPAQLVARAAERRLNTIALTDHDTLDGVTDAQAAAAEAGIELITGTELSVDWPTGTLHLLVYHLEPGRGPLQDRLGELQTSRASRNDRIVSRLRELGFDITIGEVRAEGLDRGIGRPHIAAVLLEKGYVTSIAEAFDRYLANGRAAYVERDRLPASEAIRLARASSAVPVIAHPHTLGVSQQDFESTFTSLTDQGLGGIEAYYGEYPPELRSHLARICERLGIAATGGSDFHGTYKPGLDVGVGRGDLVVPDRVLEDLAAQREDSHSA